MAVLCDLYLIYSYYFWVLQLFLFISWKRAELIFINKCWALATAVRGLGYPGSWIFRICKYYVYLMYI